MRSADGRPRRRKSSGCLQCLHRADDAARCAPGGEDAWYAWDAMCMFDIRSNCNSPNGKEKYNTDMDIRRRR